MPTYLLALCTGRLKGKTVSSQHNRNITAWGPPSLEEIGEVDVALGVSASSQSCLTAVSDSSLCTVVCVLRVDRQPAVRRRCAACEP